MNFIKQIDLYPMLVDLQSMYAVSLESDAGVLLGVELAHEKIAARHLGEPLVIRGTILNCGTLPQYNLY